MKSIIFLCQLFLIIRTNAQSLPAQCNSTDTNRPPENSDITVVCGTRYIDLSILLCPIYSANYNGSLMILNNRTDCVGAEDFSVYPPVLRFRLSLDEQSANACSSVFRIINSVGTGDLSYISNVQHVNISGIVVSFDPATGLITYRPSITYLYSCKYALQYVLNNTQLAVAGVNLAINDNNGTFISTLSMELFSDPDYRSLLIIPDTGINLKDRIYVKVSATNLTDRFHVLLDRCFATVEEYKEGSAAYDLFVGCTSDPQTRVEENGDSQNGLFSFEAFRFVLHKNLSVSTFYIHCVTRLCNTSTCASLKPNCDEPRVRRRRDTAEGNSAESATVISPPIIVGQQTRAETVHSEQHSGAAADEYSSPVVAVIVCVAILSLLLVAMAAYFTFNLRQKLRL